MTFINVEDFTNDNKILLYEVDENDNVKRILSKPEDAEKLENVYFISRHEIYHALRSVNITNKEFTIDSLHYSSYGVGEEFLQKVAIKHFKLKELQSSRENSAVYHDIVLFSLAALRIVKEKLHENIKSNRDLYHIFYDILQDEIAKFKKFNDFCLEKYHQDIIYCYPFIVSTIKIPVELLTLIFKNDNFEGAVSNVDILDRSNKLGIKMLGLNTFIALLLLDKEYRFKHKFYNITYSFLCECMYKESRLIVNNDYSVPCMEVLFLPNDTLELNSFKLQSSDIFNDILISKGTIIPAWYFSLLASILRYNDLNIFNKLGGIATLMALSMITINKFIISPSNINAFDINIQTRSTLNTLGHALLYLLLTELNTYYKNQSTFDKIMKDCESEPVIDLAKEIKNVFSLP